MLDKGEDRGREGKWREKGQESIIKVGGREGSGWILRGQNDKGSQLSPSTGLVIKALARAHQAIGLRSPAGIDAGPWRWSASVAPTQPLQGSSYC